MHQFSKIAKKNRDETAPRFEFVFIAVHNTEGRLFLFDATQVPPRVGIPSIKSIKSINDVLDQLAAIAKNRQAKTEIDALPTYTAFTYEDGNDENEP